MPYDVLSFVATFQTLLTTNRYPRRAALDSGGWFQVDGYLSSHRSDFDRVGLSLLFIAPPFFDLVLVRLLC